MTKTTKSVNHFNTSNNGIVKKAAKCAKLQSTAVVAVALKKKLLMTEEQEAAVAETIAFVIKSKVCTKNVRKPPLDANKSPKRKSISPIAKDTAKKLTASPAKINKAAKKDANSVDSSKSGNIKKSAAASDNVAGKKVAKRAAKSKSPSTRATKQDNKGEIKDNKAETKSDGKQASAKLKAERDEKEAERKVDLADKSPTRKDKRDKEMEREKERTADDNKAPHKIAKEKKDAEKLIKEKNSDVVDKSARGRKDLSKDKTKITSNKVKDAKTIKAKVKGEKQKMPSKTKTAEIVKKKKPIAVKVKKVNLKRLNKSAPTVKKKKLTGNEGLMKKVCKVAHQKDETKKTKFKIKEEQLDEVLTVILKSSSRPDADKPENGEKDAAPTTKKQIPKVNPSVLAKKLKAKLKAAPLANALKSNVIVKSKHQKAKLVAKPIQQVKSRKLLSIWNGPKRHRVASLNAMAKVHCLYDNEFRGNFDQMDMNVKREAAEEAKRARSLKNERQSPSPQPTRTLRSVPGLRAVGKMWDMHDTTSSSEDDYAPAVKTIKKVVTPKVPVTTDHSTPIPEKRASTVSKAKKPVVKRRKKEEVIMDLKDMVVRKRMASLNASAILAASYSVEKRTRRNGDSDTDSETTSDTEEYSSDERSEHEMKKVEDIKKEEKIDCKVIEVRAVPSKKVAVILNQDTDVTFTGVYMNSTTRSTHHEGYCHIAGMKYRISATSHTQTAATAVATETILQSTTTTTHENETPDAPPVKSYTPLDALSNMQPPANATSALPPQPHHHHMQPPAGAAQHHPHHIGSLARRHGCATSAFSAPQGHHNLPSLQPDHGYIQGYYQPAGPLISVHGHSQAPPPPTLSSKSVPLSDLSPTSTSPLLQPPPPNSAGDSSDSEVIITSVTTAKEALAAQQQHQQQQQQLHQQQQPPPTAYRLNHHYPPPPPHGAYSAYGPYPPQYYGAPPPPPGPAAYPHHDMCYTSFPPHKYMFRRYLAPPAPPYYQPSSPDLYGQPPSTNQQVVTASNAASGSYQSSSTGPPPPTLMESYPGPPPTLIETYSSPAHYYQGYGPAPPCYTHSPPARPLNYINTTYQPCPCPMQSCPKNVHTGPLAGDSKRSNIAIAKESMPLPPVALALPLEPASATGPPSPARGSAGMPPPPSPAGATYQPPPPPKQETPEPAATDASGCQQQVEKRRKARVGKAMVRNTIAQNQQNTMLLMCQTPTITPTTTILGNVKREVESPKEEAIVPEVEKTLLLGATLEKLPSLVEPSIAAKIEENADVVLVLEHENNIKCEKLETPESLEKRGVETRPAPPLSQSPPPSPSTIPNTALTVAGASPPPPLATPPVNDELLLPCQKTVAENVKVKNMKRKCSMSKEAPQVEVPSPAAAKKPKLDKPNGSYKDLIKKTQNVVKINNGRRKLITETRTVNGVLIRIRKNNKRKFCIAALAANKMENGRRPKPAKPLTDSNVPLNVKVNGAKDAKAIVDPELIENKEPSSKKTALKKPQQPVEKTKKLLVNGESKLSNLDRTIESVVHNLRTPKVQPESAAIAISVLRTEKVAEQRVAEKIEKVESIQCRRISNGERSAGAKKVAANNKVTKVKRSTGSTETPAKVALRRSNKPKEVTAQAISRVPRRSAQLRWSNGWRWHGEPFDGKVFLNSDETTVLRKCYPAMVHEEGDIIEPRDCVLLKAGQRKNELPFVAKIAALWENPDDGEMMMSLLWYYRPEHTEQGRRPVDQPDEVFASRHKDSNSVACIEDKCYVLTYNEYCRYRKDLRRLEAFIEDAGPCIPQPDPYPRLHRQPPSTLGTSADLVFFCRKVYDFRQKRIIKNPS